MAQSPDGTTICHRRGRRDACASGRSWAAASRTRRPRPPPSPPFFPRPSASARLRPTKLTSCPRSGAACEGARPEVLVPPAPVPPTSPTTRPEGPLQPRPPPNEPEMSARQSRRRAVRERGAKCSSSSRPPQTPPASARTGAPGPAPGPAPLAADRGPLPPAHAPPPPSAPPAHPPPPRCAALQVVGEQVVNEGGSAPLVRTRAPLATLSVPRPSPWRPSF